MKYGKEFQALLNESSFPPEWRESAVEYGQLKKLIKQVVGELTSMGLSPDVLHRLLLTEDNNGQIQQSEGSDAGAKISSMNGEDDDGEVLEFEFESDQGSPPMLQPNDQASSNGPNHEPKEVILDPLPPSPESDNTHLIPPNSYIAHPHHRRFRLRLLSDSSIATAASTLASTSSSNGNHPLRPLSVAELIAAQEREDELTREKQAVIQAPYPRKAMRRVVADGHGGVKAEYVLTGDPTHPVPQLRLHLSTSPSPSSSSIDASAEGASSSIDTDTEDENDESDSQPETSTSVDYMATPRAFSRTAAATPSSPSLNKLRAAQSPIWAIASGEVQDGLGSLSLGDAAVAEEEYPFATPASSEKQEISTPTPGEANINENEREFIIPLASDMAFFNLLTTALTSLSTFHTRQQDLFRQSVERLCEMISQSIQPGLGGSSAIEIIPTPLTPSSPISSTALEPKPKTSRSLRKHSTTSKKDLYAWREIFTLWIQSEIFESSAERDRGERTVAQAQTRLQNFAKIVVGRGLGDRRTMKGKKVREAWEEFLRLNVLLLDLKRFQEANINAARKILKKHDKRTALTASAGFPAFVRSTLSAHVDQSGNISTWTFYNTSLPHVLLASLTDTLLPILPSLDDYACLICTSIAFKPIRLTCGHLFCVRCLVKMQREGKADCPLCRSKVVLLADKNSLDITVMNFMKEWFPKEVKEKERENQDERAREEAQAVGLDTRCIIM